MTPIAMLKCPSPFVLYPRPFIQLFDYNTQKKSKSKKKTMAICTARRPRVYSALKQALNIPGLRVHINVKITRRSRQTRDSLDIRSLSIEISSTRRQTDITDGNSEASGCTLKVRVVGE